MRNLIIAGVAGSLLAGGAAMASEPVTLSDQQLDELTAGAFFRLGAGLAIAARGDAMGSRRASSESYAVGGFRETTTLYYDTAGEVERAVVRTVAGGSAGTSSKASSYRRGGPPAKADAGYNIAGGVYIEYQD